MYLIVVKGCCENHAINLQSQLSKVNTNRINKHQRINQSLTMNDKSVDRTTVTVICQPSCQYATIMLPMCHFLFTFLSKRCVKISIRQSKRETVWKREHIYSKTSRRSSIFVQSRCHYDQLQNFLFSFSIEPTKNLLHSIIFWNGMHYLLSIYLAGLVSENLRFGENHTTARCVNIEKSVNKTTQFCSTHSQEYIAVVAD